MNLDTREILCNTRRLHKPTYVLSFLTLIDLHVPRHLEFDVVLDNLSAQKVEPIAWLGYGRRTRRPLPCTPTSLSLLNLTEVPFSHRPQRQLSRAAFRSVDDFTAIETRPARWNGNPRSFVWKMPANEILSKLKRGHSALTTIKSATHHEPRPDTRKRSRGDTS